MKLHQQKTLKSILLLFGLYSSLNGQTSSKLLDKYIQIALENNPGVQQAFHRWKAEETGVKKAGGFPNPTVSLGYFLENVETAAGPQESKIGINQKIPFFGKRSASAGIQSSQSKKAYYSFQKRRLVVIDLVRSTWLDSYFLKRKTDLTRQNFELVKNWDHVIRSKYITARTGHPDLVKTQIELIQLEDELKSLKGQHKPLLEKFRSIINNQKLSTIAISDSIVIAPIQYSQEALLGKIEKTNPDLQIAIYEIEKQKSKEKLAKLRWLPDFGIGVESIRTGEKDGSDLSGKDPLVAKISLDLPLWFGKNKSAVQSASYGKSAAEDQLNAVQNDLKVALEKVMYDLNESNRQIELYRDVLIPKGRESLSVTETAYRTDKIDFIALVDAQRRLLQFHLKYEKAIVDYLKAKSKLSVLTGETPGQIQDNG